jgi:hypothetical protein
VKAQPYARAVSSAFLSRLAGGAALLTRTEEQILTGAKSLTLKETNLHKGLSSPPLSRGDE